MRAGIAGVIGTAGQMVNTFTKMSTVLQAPFNLGATAVTALIVRLVWGWPQSHR